MRRKMKQHILAWLGVITLLAVFPANGAVKDQFILRCSPAAVSGIASRHGMTVLASVARQNIFLVRGPAGASATQFIADVEADAVVGALEHNADVVVPASLAGLALDPTSASILDPISK